MCGRYTITSPPDAVRAAFGYAGRPNFPARFNIAPTQPVPIVRLEDGARRFALVRWGLVPSWAKDPSDLPLLINARAETVLTKPSFRNAIRRRRCLFPADGFYEWQKTVGGPKQPWYIRARRGGVLAFAGIWEHWQGADGSEIETAAIITTDANATLMPIHHRMPVILDAADFDTWLDADGVSAAEAVALLRPVPDDLLEAWPVSTRVNRVANDDATLLERHAVEPDARENATDTPPEQLDLL